MLLERIRKTITRYSMLPAGCRVAVAVSGGADSVCLLLALCELAKEFDVSLCVAHFNHKLRGLESDEDQRFVRELAARLALPFYHAESEAQSAHGNLEQSARNARYVFFRGLLHSNVAARIAVGHTQNDQAETVLFRMLRGSGPTGIAGIQPVTSDGIVRPLLDATRAEVMEFLAERRAHWREDASNREDRFARNRIRAVLLPQLEHDWNPQLRSSLAQFADLAFEEERYWKTEMQALLSRLCGATPAGVEISARELRQLPKAVARRFVRAVIEKVQGHIRGLEFGHVEAALDLTAPSANGRGVRLPGIQIRHSQGVILFRSGNDSQPAAGVTHLTGPGRYCTPDGSWMIVETVTECVGSGHSSPGQANPSQQNCREPVPGHYREENGATLKSADLWLPCWLPGWLPSTFGGVGSFMAGSGVTDLGGDGGSSVAVAEVGSDGDGVAAKGISAGQDVLGATAGAEPVAPSLVWRGLVLRAWQAGDRYRPQGHSKDQKIKEMFQRARIPSWRRVVWPIVTYGGAIVWARQFGPAAEVAAGAANAAGSILRIWVPEDLDGLES